MSPTEETKWLTKRFAIRYIPHRYQAWVATIFSGLLLFRMWSIAFTPNVVGGDACGSFVRPVLDKEDSDNPIGWVWNIIGDFDKAQCPRTMNGLWWEFLFGFVGLAICGLVLRRAIKRHDTNTAPQ